VFNNPIANQNIMSSFSELKEDFEIELNNILTYWEENTIDHKYGGFLGKINHENVVFDNAPKGVVLNARILWSFSSAYLHSKNDTYLKIAERAFKYIVQYFWDQEFGGVYWTVDFKGEPLDTKKQIYALAFVIYGLTEYYQASGDKEAISFALKCYHDIENHSFDKENGGYLEALTRNWMEIDDLRLSNKDVNEKKTMNTHLHILEAYTNLYRVWPDKELKKVISSLLNVFIEHIIDPKTNHLILFLDENWTAKSKTVSYGHDIEASWLLLEAAEVIQDEKLIERFKLVAVQMADAASKGIASNGALIYECEPAADHIIGEKHWWVQAEAMVGFFNAWQLTGEQKYYNHFTGLWSFVDKYIIDHERGEWVWGINEDYSIMDHEDKVGLWKCPYHNSRACLEILHRLDTV